MSPAPLSIALVVGLPAQGTNLSQESVCPSPQDTPDINPPIPRHRAVESNWSVPLQELRDILPWNECAAEQYPIRPERCARAGKTMCHHGSCVWCNETAQKLKTRDQLEWTPLAGLVLPCHSCCRVAARSPNHHALHARRLPHQALPVEGCGGLVDDALCLIMSASHKQDVV